MNAISRILPRLIIERLRDCYESLIMENQFDFRQNRSTTDAIFIVREAIKSTIKGVGGLGSILFQNLVKIDFE